VNFLNNLWTACGAFLEKGIFPDVPDPGLPGENIKLNIDADEAKRFGQIVKTSLVAARAALALDTTIAESAQAWNVVFGPEFPVVPATSTRSVQLSRTATQDEEEDAEDAIAEDISELDLPARVRLGTVKIKALTSPTRYAEFRNVYPSGGRPLAKGMWLKFSIDATSITPPYDIQWKVKNHGKEAAAHDDIAERDRGTQPTQFETTAYRGSHLMICELSKQGVVVARGKHMVNVRR
jgi:hypothetical protein